MTSPTITDDLRAALAAQPRRPILHHLNADTTWLIQLPIPSSAATTSPTPTGKPQRIFFNILLDPWLAGTQADVASWFSQQWHATPSAYQSIAAVQALCEATERLGEVSPHAQGDGEKGEAEAVARDPGYVPVFPEGAGGKWTGENYVDAVAISHEFTDHCHKQTLLELPRTTPVFAWGKAGKTIRGWKHFERVSEVQRFERDWRGTSSALPSWIGIGNLSNESDGLYYHSALVISFDLGSVFSSSTTHSSSTAISASTSESDSNTIIDPINAPSSSSSAECIIYTPHGLHAGTLAPIPLASPPLRPLALLHGLHDIWLDWRQQLNLGAHAGLAAQRMLRAPYWVGTHDEEKEGRGVVSWFLRRRRVSVGMALDQEEEGWEGVREKVQEGQKGKRQPQRQRGIRGKEGDGVDKWDEKREMRRQVGWRDMGNGAVLLLREDGE